MTEVLHYWIRVTERTVARYWPSDTYANLCGGGSRIAPDYTGRVEDVTCPDCLKKLGVETKPEDSVGMTAVGEDDDGGNGRSWYLVRHDNGLQEEVLTTDELTAAKLVLNRTDAPKSVTVQKLGEPREFRRVTAVEEVK